MATTLEAVVRAISDSMKAAGGVHPNVVITTHADYLELANLPVVALFYPEMDRWNPNEMNEKRVDKNPDGKTTIVRPPKIFKSLVFEVQLISETTIGVNGLLQLQTNFIIWLQKNRTITAEGIVYEVHGQEPQKPLYTANISNLKRADASLTVQGVEIDTAEQKPGYVVLNRLTDSAIL